MALFAMHFSEIFRGEHAPGPPLQKLPPMAVALSATEKKPPTFP